MKKINNMTDFSNNNINNIDLIDPDAYKKYNNNIINELYDKTDIIWKSDYFIYLHSSPEKCLENIYKRGRDNEMDISLEYLNNIHEYHEKAYENLKDKKIIIDVNNKSIEEICEIINKFIHKL